jgi:hypothetical protein
MDLHIKTMAEYAAEGKSPEVLFWVGCAEVLMTVPKKSPKHLLKS